MDLPRDCLGYKSFRGTFSCSQYIFSCAQDILFCAHERESIWSSRDIVSCPRDIFLVSTRYFTPCPVTGSVCGDLLKDPQTTRIFCVIPLAHTMHIGDSLEFKYLYFPEPFAWCRNTRPSARAEYSLHFRCERTLRALIALIQNNFVWLWRAFPLNGLDDRDFLQNYRKTRAMFNFITAIHYYFDWPHLPPPQLSAMSVWNEWWNLRISAFAGSDEARLVRNHQLCVEEWTLFHLPTHTRTHTHTHTYINILYIERHVRTDIGGRCVALGVILGRWLLF